MKVLDYALGGLVAASDAGQHPRQRTAVSYPTPAFSTAPAPYPYAPVPTAAAGIPYGMSPEQHRANLVIKPRYLVARNQSIDTTKPMLGLYPEDQVTTETSTFENGIDPAKWVLDTRSYGGATNNPYMRKMEPKNVEASDGLLKLKVPGGQTYDPVTNLGLSSAQIKSMKIFSVGSIEITVKMSSTPGTCQCAFLYGSDDNEVDMEYLTRTNVSWSVIQPMSRTQPIQQQSLNITVDQTADFHTYKVVRTENTAYYLYDGQLVNQFTKDVPTKPVQAMIAHWTDANPGWTGGPPEQDAIMEIKKIVVEYVGATSTFSTSTETPSPTGSAGKKGAASRQYGSAMGPLLAIAAVLSYFAS